jgi:hypothetical protein
MLLLGPMVRCVTYDTASVFVATSVEAQAQLAVSAGRLESSDVRDADFSAPAVALDRIGERLWVGLVQAALPVTRSAGQVFSYDIRLITPEGSFRLDDLDELGTSTDAIAADTPLGYEPGMLPSFVVPPADVASLRLAHGSCRKPHGGDEGEPDALAILDEVIALSLGVSATDPATVSTPEAPPTSNRERPHQLVLTGDQIYADDVQAGMLTALMEAGDELLGWKEEVPGVVVWNQFMAWPGWRTRLLAMQEIVEVPDIGTTDYSANHLLTFAEWTAMYLFAWSDALWARSEDGLGVVLPKADYRLQWTETVDVAETIDNLADGKIIDSEYKLWADLGAYLDKFSEEIAEVWNDTVDQAMRYGASVRKVRRLLANVATYTICDDHEITDDWFLDRDKTNRLLGVDAEGSTADLGPRLLRNGLSAYAIFQHWGNVPSDFGVDAPAPPRDGSTLGVQLLGLWSVAPSEAGIASPSLAGQARAADAILGIDVQPSPIPPEGTARVDFGRMRWDYALSFDSHRLIVLDTRTWRFFPDKTPFDWPRDLPPAERTPEQTATLEYIDAEAAAWKTAATTAGSIEAETFAALVQACADAAGAADASATEAHLRAAADATETLLAPLWSDDGFAHAMLEIDLFRETLDPAGPLIGSGDATPADLLWQGTSFLSSIAVIPTETKFEPLSGAFAALATMLESAAIGTTRGVAGSVANVLSATGADVFDIFVENVDARATLALAINEAGPAVAAALEALVPDVLSEEFFRDGSHQLGAALISEGALRFQLTDPIGAEDPDAPPTIVVSPAPIFGNALVETVQRALLVLVTLEGGAGAEVLDYEGWGVNAPAMTSLFRAARALPRCVVLSGDVHYANSSVNDVEILAEGVATRYVQLTSSALRNADGVTVKLGFLDDMLWGLTGEFAMSPMGVSKQLTAAAPDDGQSTNEGPSLPGWADEIALKWLHETFSLKTFAEWLSAQYEDLPQSPLEVIRWLVLAPYDSATAWGAEAAYQSWTILNFAEELREDKLHALFGDYLYAPDVLRQQLIDFYLEWGVDPALGPQIRRTMLRDLRYLPAERDDRLKQYRARARYDKYDPGSDTRRFADQQYVQTVGSNNVGLVRFVTDGGVLTGVSHELLWYPVAKPVSSPRPEIPAKPAGLVIGVELPRVDWMGTLHEGTWTACAHRLDDLRAATDPAVG